MALPDELWRLIIQGADLDEWVKYGCLDRRLRAISYEPSVLRSLKLYSVRDTHVDIPNSFFLLIVVMAQAGHIGARVRILSHWSFYEHCTHKRTIEIQRQYLADKNVIPYMMRRLSQPYKYKPSLQRMYNMSNAEARLLYDGIVPYKCDKPCKVPPAHRIRISLRDQRMYICWIYDACLALGIEIIFTRARHVFLWYLATVNAPIDEAELALCAAASIILTGRTTGAPINDSEASIVAESALVELAASTRHPIVLYDVPELHHFMDKMSGLLPPLMEHVPSLIMTGLGTNHRIYMWPLFCGYEVGTSIIERVYERCLCARTIVEKGKEINENRDAEAEAEYKAAVALFERDASLLKTWPVGSVAYKDLMTQARNTIDRHKDKEQTKTS